MALYAGRGRSADSWDMIADETQGFAFDATTSLGGSLSIKDTTTPANNRRNVSLDSFAALVNSGTSAKIVNIDSTTLGWSPHNLLLQSEDFATTWSNVRSSKTVNVATAPDGTATADKLIEDATATNSHFFQQTYAGFTAGFIYTLSCYLKASERNWAQVRFSATSFGANAHGNFDLTNGVIGTLGSSALSQGIQSIGNGWYRCWVTSLCTTTASAVVTINTSTGDEGLTYNGDNTSGIYCWGAQLSRGANLTPYLKTVASAVYGIPQEWDGTRFGMIIEPAATNLILRSQEFDNASWTKGGETIVANFTTAPDGTTTADEITTTSTTDDLLQSVTCVTLTDYTHSCYFKASTLTQWIKFVSSPVSATNSVRAWFDILNGVTGSQTTTGTGWTAKGIGMEYVGNGWYRCWHTFNTTGTVLQTTMVIAPSDGGNGGTTGSKYYAWGAQDELGVVPTSYIQTTTATVTRAADKVNIPTSAYPHSATNGTFIAWAKYRIVDNTAANRMVEISDGTNAENMSIQPITADTPDSIGIFVADGNVTQVAPATTKTGSLNIAGNKVAAAYQLNNFGIVVDGGSEVTDVAGTLPTVTSLQLGYATATASREMNGYLYQLTYIPRRMTQAEMQARTT